MPAVHHPGRTDPLDDHPGRQGQHRPRQAEGGAEESSGGEAQAEGANQLRQEWRVHALAEVQEEGGDEKPAEGTRARESLARSGPGHVNRWNLVEPGRAGPLELRRDLEQPVLPRPGGVEHDPDGQAVASRPAGTEMAGMPVSLPGIV